MIVISEGLQESHRYHTTHTRETNQPRPPPLECQEDAAHCPQLRVDSEGAECPFLFFPCPLLSDLTEAATPTSKEPDFLATIYLSLLSCVQVRFLSVGAAAAGASKSPEKCVICSTLRANSRFCSFARRPARLIIILDSYG